MCVHVDGKTHIMRTTMKQLEASLDPEIFIRVHRSSIVNANSIATATSHLNGEYVLTLEGGARLKVSRGSRERIKALLDTWRHRHNDRLSVHPQIHTARRR